MSLGIAEGSSCCPTKDFRLLDSGRTNEDQLRHMNVALSEELWRPAMDVSRPIWAQSIAFWERRCYYSFIEATVYV